MQLLATELIKSDILSLRHGGPIGVVDKILLNETNLRVRLLAVALSGEKKLSYLQPNDIRLSENKKIIVDSEEVFTAKEDLIRDRTTIEQNITLFNLPVVTVSDKKLGRVEDFTFDNNGYLVTKLHVQASLLQNLVHHNLIIDRSDIVDIKPDKVIVRDAYANGKQMMTNVLPAKNS